MNTSIQAKWFNAISLSVALLLLIMLPTAGRMRSPGGVSSDWHICAFATAFLIWLNVLGLNTLWHEKWSKRLGLYISSGIVIGAFFMLIHFWQEQQQFDHWSHRSIRYVDQP
jgi:hypothetical protein